MLLRLLMVSLMVLGLNSPIQAGIFRNKKKPDPTTYVPELLTALKTDKDERVRANAASELRDYDGKVFPEIIPALIDALGSDPSSSVRAEAAESIGKIRPITNKGGAALEYAASNDKALLVRFAAKNALLAYRFLGFIGVSKTDLPTAQTKEPPFAKPSTPIPAPGSPVIRPIPSTLPGTNPPPPIPPTSPSTTVREMPAKMPPVVPTPEPLPAVPTVKPTLPEEEKTKPIPALVIPAETPKVSPLDVELPVPPVPPVPPATGPKIQGPALGSPSK